MPGKGESKNGKEELHRRVPTPGATLKGIAGDLGISRGALKEWVGKLGSETTPAGTRASAASAVRSESQAANVSRLEAELTVAQPKAHKLAEERDVLRQAAKYFAGETNW